MKSKQSRDFIDRLESYYKDREDVEVFTNPKMINFDISDYDTDKINELPPGYDYRPLPDCLYIGFSEIEGNGLFTLCDLTKDITLGVSHILVKDKLIRTPLGGFLNASKDPNCIVTKTNDLGDDNFYLVCLKDIAYGEELTVDYFNSACGLEKICKK